MGTFYKMVILSKFHTMEDITKEDFNNYVNFYFEYASSEFNDLNWFLLLFILLFNEKDVATSDVDFTEWYLYIQRVLRELNQACPIDEVDIRLCEVALALNTYPDTNWTTLKAYEIVKYHTVDSYKCDLSNKTEIGYFCWHEVVQYLMVFDAHEHQHNYKGLMERVSESNLTNDLHQVVLAKYTQYIEAFDADENNS